MKSVVRAAWRLQNTSSGLAGVGSAILAQLSVPGYRTTAGDMACEFRDVTLPKLHLTAEPIDVTDLRRVDDDSVDFRYEVLASSMAPTSQPPRIRVQASGQVDDHIFFGTVKQYQAWLDLQVRSRQ